MDRYDDMLLKARAEMLGKEPLRKAPPHDALFSHVWNHVVKAPADDPYGLMQGYQNERNQQRQQQVQERTQSSPAPADPFGQMNEGASLDGPTQGMGANFRQGRQETRDPNKTGMFGRAKQGIGNFMNRFKRTPSQQTESTPPSLQEEPAPADERSFMDTPRAELPPSFRSWNRYGSREEEFPTRDWVRNNMDAGGNDLAEWERMNALREQREAETQQTQQAEQGNDLRAATRDKMTPSAWPSPMQEAQERKPAVDAGMDAMREPVDNDFYNRFAGVEEQPMRQPQSEAPAPVEEQREFSDPFGQMNGLEEREELPPDFNTEIEPQQMLMTDPPYIGGQEEMTEERQNEDALSYKERASKNAEERNPEALQRLEESQMLMTDPPYVGEQEDENPDWMKGMDEEEYTDWARSMRNEYGGQEESPRATTRTGTEIPRKALPAPKVAPENRQLPESTGENKPGEMAGIPSKARTGFNEVNNRSEGDKAKQDPRARGKNNRLMETKRREKLRNEKYNVMPEEQQEKAPPKKAAPKKAKKSPAAKAVKNTDKGKEVAEANKKGALEGTEEMREEAPKKGAAKVKATTSKKAPKMEIGEGAERIEAKPKKGAAKVKATTSKAKPKEGSALARVNSLDEKRKAGENPSKPFANKAKPARKRTKNPKKAAIEGLGEAAARSRTRQAAKAKKNEPSEESAPEKEYGLSISGSASESDISEIMEAARNGNKSAQSAVYNNAATLEDIFKIPVDDIREASGR